MAIVSSNYSVPEIKLNGKELPIKDMSCRKIEITKEVGNVDIIHMELIGKVEIETIDTSHIYVKVIDPMTEKCFKFRMLDFIQADSCF